MSLKARGADTTIMKIRTPWRVATKAASAPMAMAEAGVAESSSAVPPAAAAGGRSTRAGSKTETWP